MTLASPVIGMQVARQLLAAAAPELVAEGRARWNRWLARQATRPTGTPPDLYVISTPTCPADLDAMLGVHQLLGLDGLDSAVLFCLPNPVAARLFRTEAQQQGIDRLIHLRDRPNPQPLVSNLDPDAVVCFIPPEAILTATFLEALRTVMEGRSPGFRDLAGCIVARASAFHLLRSAAALPGAGLSIRLETLLSGRESRPGATVGMLLALFDRAGAGSPRRPAPAGAGTAGALTRDPGEIRLDDLPPGAEIAIEAEGPDGWQVFFRQSADLLGDTGAVAVFPPIQLAGSHVYPARVGLGAGDAAVRAPFDLRLLPRDIAPWMMTCYLNRGGAGNEVIRAFACGTGARLRYAEDEAGPRPGVPVVWGVLRGSMDVIDRARAAGQYFFYIDHAYFERGHGRNYRVTRNRFEAGPVRRCPPDRRQALDIDLRPWRTGGREIIVCPPTDYFMKAHDCADWLEVALDTLNKATDRPVVVRAKPQPGETVVPLPAALETAHALVTHSSNVAVEAAVLGTPVFVSPTSAAAPVGHTSLAQIEHPVRPDREAWLARLAYSQFTLAEMRDGSAWKMLMDTEDRDLADRL